VWRAEQPEHPEQYYFSHTRYRCQRKYGVIINRTGPHRATLDHTGLGPYRNGTEMTDYFTSTTN